MDEITIDEKTGPVAYRVAEALEIIDKLIELTKSKGRERR